MLKYKVAFIVIVLPLAIFSQEIVKKSVYSIRDFSVHNDSIYYLEHTELFLTDSKNNRSISCFVGGFGLEFYALDDNELLTVANELVKNVSSFRFYNKKLNKIEDSFFYNKGKVIDFIKIPELNVFVFSATNKKIVFINFDDRKEIRKIIEIKLNSLSRKLLYKNKELFYCTDNGEIYKYSINNYKKELIYKTKGIITDFNFVNDELICSTIEGNIIKVDLSSKKEQKLKIKDNFVLNTLQYNDSLICGSWKGIIYVIDLKKFEVNNVLEYHNAAVLKILNYDDAVFYSSSIDKTIKKWNLK